MPEIKNFQSLLFENQDVKYGDFHSRLMPTIAREKIIGVRIPVLRKLSKELFKNNQAEVEKFLQELPHQYYEENNLHAFLLEQILDFDSAVLQIEKFLPHIDNWATCDSLKPNSFKKVAKKNPEKILPFIKKWINSSAPYTIRFGIGCLMNYFLDENFSSEYLTLVSKIQSEEYYVKMMQAWYFATALSKQYDSTLPIIQNCTLEPWTHNKAIQKAVESYRITPEQKEFLKTLKISIKK